MLFIFIHNLFIKKFIYFIIFLYFKMKFSHANRFFSINENYNPPSNYYSGPSDPKFNTIYKITFGNNLENLEENKNLFGK